MPDESERPGQNNPSSVPEEQNASRMESGAGTERTDEFEAKQPQPPRLPELSPLPVSAGKFENSPFVEKPGIPKNQMKIGHALITILVTFVLMLSAGLILSFGSIIAVAVSLWTVLSVFSLLAIWTAFGPGKIIIRLTHVTVALIILGTIGAVFAMLLGLNSTVEEFMGYIASAYVCWVCALVPPAAFRLFFGWRFQDTYGRLQSQPLSIADLMIATVLVAIAVTVSQGWIAQANITEEVQAQILPFRIWLLGYALTVNLIGFLFVAAPAVAMIMTAKSNADGFGRIIVYSVVAGLQRHIARFDISQSQALV
ncbi:MAG: hypothetical protein AAF456_25025 [Planctomycetota bacterium]